MRAFGVEGKGNGREAKPRGARQAAERLARREKNSSRLPERERERQRERVGGG